MHLNTLKPAKGSRPVSKRVGRGIGSGLGKTCGRGHKGQTSRAGKGRKIGFEGGQMPLQRRLPKVGFTSRKTNTRAEVRLHELALVQQATIDLASLKAAGIVPQRTQCAKIIASGTLTKAVQIKGIKVTKGARIAIEAAQGSIED